MAGSYYPPGRRRLQYASDATLTGCAGPIRVGSVRRRLSYFLICTRYKANRSLIITTNRPYGEWDKTFANDNVIASAITDRLVHHSRTFILTGESRRLHEHQSA